MWCGVVWCGCGVGVVSVWFGRTLSVVCHRRNVLETPKLVGKLSTPRAIMRTSFEVKGKGEGHQADIMLRPEVRHILKTERTTNFKLGAEMEDEELYRCVILMAHHQQWLKVKIAMSRHSRGLS